MNEDIATLEIRDGTQDEQVYKEVYEENQYELPDSLPSDSIVVDVGANIGVFAVACLMRGAGTVVCFEPDPRNYQQLVKNTSAWPGQVAPFNAAVRRSDCYEAIQYVGFDKSTACGGTFSADEKLRCPKNGYGREPIYVDSMGLDEILYHVTEGGKSRVKLLKVDIEGSEYKVMYTSKHLGMVDTIVGEAHQISGGWPTDTLPLFGYTNDRACGEGMRKYLESQGFKVRTKESTFSNQTNTIFIAERIGTPTPENE